LCDESTISLTSMLTSTSTFEDMTRFNEHGGIGSLSFMLTELLTLPPGLATVVCGLGFVATAGAGGLLGKAWIICR
jgi:hypothetical protein